VKQSVVDALAELQKLGFVTRIRRLKQVDTALGFKAVQTTNAYLVHEPASGLGLLAIRMFCAESGYPAASIRGTRRANNTHSSREQKPQRFCSLEHPINPKAEDGPDGLSCKDDPRLARAVPLNPIRITTEKIIQHVPGAFGRHEEVDHQTPGSAWMRRPLSQLLNRRNK
jgi:hypothetical protein